MQVVAADCWEVFWPRVMLRRQCWLPGQGRRRGAVGQVSGRRRNSEEKSSCSVGGWGDWSKVLGVLQMRRVLLCWRQRWEVQ